MATKALIVDDENDIGLMVSKILVKEGLEVDYVDRIASAKQRVDQSVYDVYLLDLNLPDGTGFDLIPMIRQKSEQSRIIIISAHDGTYEMNKIKEESISTFIKKPFTKAQIVEAIHGLGV